MVTPTRKAAREPGVAALEPDAAAAAVAVLVAAAVVEAKLVWAVPARAAWGLEAPQSVAPREAREARAAAPAPAAWGLGARRGAARGAAWEARAE